MMPGDIALAAAPSRDILPGLQKVDRFVTPIGDARAAAFVVEHLYVAHGLIARLAWPFHRRTGGRALIKVTDPDAISAGSRAAIERALRDASSGSRPISWILETDYAGRPRDRSIVFVFAEDSCHPALVLKRAPISSDAGLPSLTTERNTLAALRRSLPRAIARTLPDVVSHDRSNGWESLALTWLPGRSAYVEMHTRIAPSAASAVHFSQAARWLARFHEATQLRDRTSGPAGLADPAGAAEASGRTPNADWFARLCDASEARPVRAVVSHGDYWARNVLFVRRGGAVEVGGVVDWESSCAGRSPFDDLFHFALTYGQSYPWSRYRRADALTAFTRTFLEENRVSRDVRRYLRSYCGERGLDATLLGSWFRCFLMARAARDASKGALWVRFDEMTAAASRSVFSG